MPLQGLVNRVVRGVLRTPGLSRLAGQRLLTIYVVGRRTGRQYAVPVAYIRAGGGLLVGSQFGWIRNLHTGQPVDVRLAGKRRSADVRVETAEDEVVEHLATMSRDNHQFAKLNRIGFDRDGEPVLRDLLDAWAAGARVAVLTPR